MERYSFLIYAIGWFGFIFFVSYLINWLLARSIIWKHYRFFVAPGVVVHELSHALGCIVMGAQITDINFWKANGGHVEHYPPKAKLIGEAIIALAPIWGTLALLAVLTKLLVPNAFLYASTFNAQGIIESFNWFSWQSWLYIYLVTSLMATIAPSKTDMRYALASLVILTLALTVLLTFLPIVVHQLNQLLKILRPFLIFTVLLGSMSLTIAFLLALPNRGKKFVARSQIE
jgi:hypothetical protein